MCLKVLVGHTDMISSAAFNHDGNLIVSASHYDKTIRIWDTQSGVCLKVIDASSRSASFKKQLVQSIIYNDIWEKIEIIEYEGIK